jgi:hypothetical protein
MYHFFYRSFPQKPKSVQCSMKISTEPIFYKTMSILRDHPSQGLSEARWVMEAFILEFLLLLIRRGGVPSGAAAFIMNTNRTLPIFHHIEYYDFKST